MANDQAIERLTGSLWMITKPGGYAHMNQLGRVYRDKQVALRHKDFDEVVVELRLADEPTLEPTDWLDKDFYELMQVYRWAGMKPQMAEQRQAVEAFEAVKDYIRQHFVPRLAVKSSGSSYFDREDAILTRANSILRELVGIRVEDDGVLRQVIQRATRLLAEWESPVEISAPQGDELGDLYELKFLCREWNNAEKAAYQLSMSKDPNKPATGSPEWQKVFSAAEKAWVDVDTWFKRHHP